MPTLDHYEWKPNSRVPIAAETAAGEFLDIRRQHGGVTPALVVARATPEAAPLHPGFEWDDQQAAREYRETQARHMIRSLVVCYRQDDGKPVEPIRMLVKVAPAADDRDPSRENDVAYQPNTYIPLRAVMEEPDYRRQYLLSAYRDVVAWRKRFRDLTEFAKLFELIDTLREQVIK